LAVGGHVAQSEETIAFLLFLGCRQVEFDGEMLFFELGEDECMLDID